ncbi:unnamed protein product [Didymodactylos carnosus]|uniref:UBC core domain-containing protein n=1 Tax=Didymodactylos carnosus TaxID=1234261 RepID=A0A815F8Z4_9BILA|nr:unnamed protein product [Didymodactylos carnosus]CAF1321823.1 unnamed protein product [Didymodactylos carnosus]CAF4053343.1 unnamed protein product [Didymodactylos carnosus]CAF4168208.1 unnamed protein product [Didymodactylos carnosus]
MAMVKHVLRELESLLKDPLDFIRTIELDDNNIFQWRGKMIGPEDSPYRGGLFEFDLDFPTEFPFRPPLFKFTTKIYHPNIHYHYGTVSLDLSKLRCTPNRVVRPFLEGVYSLLVYPNFDTPIELITSTLNNYDMRKHEDLAKQWTCQYALENISQSPSSVENEENISQSPPSVENEENISQSPPSVENGGNISQSPPSVENGGNISQSPPSVESGIVVQYTPTASPTTSESLDKISQSCTLVWLGIIDINIENCLLPNNVTARQKFSKPCQCISYITSFPQDKYYLIMSGFFDKNVLPLIHNLPQVVSIYIYCDWERGSKEMEWTNNYSKFSGIFVDKDSLFDALNEEIHSLVRTDVEITLKPPVKNCLSAATAYRNLGCALFQKQDYDRALLNFQKASELMSHSETLDLANTFNNIGCVYDKKLNHEEALKYYEKALDLSLKILPTDDPSIIEYLNNISVIVRRR